jgi:hypothetical protein
MCLLIVSISAFPTPETAAGGLLEGFDWVDREILVCHCACGICGSADRLPIE